jgi:hypothetical protein
MAFSPGKLQLAQYGLEPSFGAETPADKKIGSVVLTLKPNVPVEKVSGSGFKGMMGTVVGKQHSVFSTTGLASYNALAWLYLPSLLCSPAITTPMGATNARMWTYFPSDTEPDDCESVVIEKGSSAGASRSRGCRTTDLDLTFNPEKATVDVKGTILGQRNAAKEDNGDPVEMTADPTRIAEVMCSGIGAYLAADEAGLGAGRIQPLMHSWSVKGRHTPVFTNDETQDSYEDTVEKGLDVTGQIVVRADSDAADLIDALRDGTVKFLRYRCLGPEIEDGFNHELILTMPIVFVDLGEQDDEDAFCRVFDWEAVYDETFGGRIKAEIQTSLAALA